MRLNSKVFYNNKLVTFFNLLMYGLIFHTLYKAVVKNSTWEIVLLLVVLLLNLFFDYHWYKRRSK